MKLTSAISSGDGFRVWMYNRKIRIHVVRHLTVGISKSFFRTYFWSIDKKPLAIPWHRSNSINNSSCFANMFRSKIGTLVWIWTKSTNGWRFSFRPFIAVPMGPEVPSWNIIQEIVPMIVPKPHQKSSKKTPQKIVPDTIPKTVSKIISRIVPETIPKFVSKNHLDLSQKSSQNYSKKYLKNYAKNAQKSSKK